MDIAPLLQPIAGESPAGQDCAHTLESQQLGMLAEYLVARTRQEELERQARGTFGGENAESDQRTAAAFAEDGRRRLELLAAAVKDVAGARPSPAAVVDEMEARATVLLARRGKDLRVARSLALAWTARAGLAGLAEGLRLMLELLRGYPGTLHPQPDEDDPTDTSAREMVVTELASGAAFQAVLRETRILEAAAAGHFSGRDAEVAEGRLDPHAAGGATSAAELRALAQAMAGRGGDAPREEPAAILQRCALAVQECLARLQQLADAVSAGSLAATPLARLLLAIERLLSQAAADTPVAQPQAATAAGAAATAGVAGGSAPNPIEAGVAGGSAPGPIEAGAGRAPAAFGAIQTREDARRMILEVCRFIEASEPSHPAPLFLRRAERLLRAKDFFAIVRDMAPGALEELEKITGFQQEAATDSADRRVQ